VLSAKRCCGKRSMKRALFWRRKTSKRVMILGLKIYRPKSKELFRNLDVRNTKALSTSFDLPWRRNITTHGGEVAKSYE
ncbi:hypothetical protein HDU96_003823, partial [Phlyctochytrium bullatum]